MKHAKLATALLLLGTAWDQGHKLVPWPMRGQMFNACGSLFIASLLGWIAYTHRSAAVLLVCALVGGFALQVAGCSIWWLFDPWKVSPGATLCSDRITLPLSMLGLCATLLVVAYLSKP